MTDRIRKQLRRRNRLRPLCVDLTLRRAWVERLEDRIVLSTSSSPIEVRQFDFNTATSPNEPGWVSVTRGTLFDETIGIGWEYPVSSDVYDSRASGNDVIKDGHTGKSGRLKVLVNPGKSYDLELIARDKKSHKFFVAVEGDSPVAMDVPRSTTVIHQISNAVSDDHVLTIDFTTQSGRDEFIVSGLRVTGERVTPNRPPVAQDDTLTLDEDTQAAVDALANDTDPDGDTFSIDSFTQPKHGTVILSGSNFMFAPDRDYAGNDSFTYSIRDSRGGVDVGTVAITIAEVNDPPVANHDLGAGFETTVDTPFVTANVLTNDADPDVYDRLSVISLDQSATAGAVHSNGDGTFLYTPPAGYAGTDVFRYTISDLSGATSSAQVTVTIRNQTAASGIWIGVDELMALPTNGPAWESLLAAAKSAANLPQISDQDDNTDVLTLAKALVGVRLGDQQLMAQARANIMAAIGTEIGGRTLALGRNLASYVIAADLVGLSPQDEEVFRAWLRTALVEELDGRTLQSTHEDRPNNWGTMAGGSRAAVAAYLGDQAELDRTALVFQGWLGDRAAYAEFKYGSDLSWQSDPSNPVGINPLGAMKEGHLIDGALPEEMRRGGSFTWPPQHTGYPWEALQGALVQAEILHRAGYNTWQWQDQALLRATEFLYGLGWDAEGDDEWQPWLINARYGTDYYGDPEARHGKIMGWTSWTHASLQAAEFRTETAVSQESQWVTPIPASETTATSIQDDKDPVLLTAQKSRSPEVHSATTGVEQRKKQPEIIKREKIRANEVRDSLFGAEWEANFAEWL